jgi:acyl carrier protein
MLKMMEPKPTGTPMTARAAVQAAILAVAPEAEEDLALLTPDDSLREMLDLDSLDFLAVMEHVARLTGISVPETDYLEVDSLASFERYLARRMG